MQKILEEEIKTQTYKERRWLMWLLKIWDDNETRPSWIMVKRNWPEEYQSILNDVGPWEMVDRKLDKAKEIQEQHTAIKMISELQRSRALDVRRKHSLEDHICGLIKLMDFLQIERLPTITEISKYASRLSIPSSSSYESCFVSKENWMPCIQGYLAVPPDSRPTVLREMEIELAKKRQKHLHLGVAKNAPFAQERCLEDLAKIYNYFGRIPTRREIDGHKKEGGWMHSATLRTHLGPLASWEEQLTEYLVQKEIETYLETYGNMKVEGAKSLDRLLEKINEAATVSERTEFDAIVQKIRQANKKKPAKFEFGLDGREFEVVIKPKG